MRIAYRMSSILIKAFMKAFFGYQLIGTSNLEDFKPCIIAANHISVFDPPFVGSVLGRELHFMAKKELFKKKLIGRFLSYFNAIPINRGVFDRTALNNVVEIIKDGGAVLFFPEGSRKSFTAKPGIGMIAYETGIPILPVYLENTNEFKNCLFRKKRVKLIIGEIFDTTHYQKLPAEKKTYRMIADEVLGIIQALKPRDLNRE